MYKSKEEFMSFTIGGDYVPPGNDPKKPMKIFIEKRRGKSVTIIKNASGDLRKTASMLKSKLSCGGSVKNDQIELQGDHLLSVEKILKS